MLVEWSVIPSRLQQLLQTSYASPLVTPTSKKSGVSIYKQQNVEHTECENQQQKIWKSWWIVVVVIREHNTRDHKRLNLTLTPSLTLSPTLTPIHYFYRPPYFAGDFNTPCLTIVQRYGSLTLTERSNRFGHFGSKFYHIWKKTEHLICKTYKTTNNHSFNQSTSYSAPSRMASMVALHKCRIYERKKG